MPNATPANAHFANRQRLALWLLWITPALWSVNYIVARSAPGVIAPHVLALCRWALAGGVLMVLARGELWRERRSTLKAAWQYLILGALGMLICGAWSLGRSMPCCLKNGQVR